MALKIRLRQQGRTNRPFYRVVLADSRSPRDGKYVEMLGWYNPFEEENNVLLDSQKIAYWVGQGAQITEAVQSLMHRAAPAVLKQATEKRQAARAKALAKRKSRQKKSKV